jgi:polysaccharide chain length determinant protein (PEP-CTERM system associated)
MATAGSAQGGSSFGLADALEILERWRWWLLLGALAGLGAGLALYLMLPPRYEATTTLLVEPQRVPESFIESTVTLEIEQRLGSLHERVTSHDNLTQLIAKVGAERLDPSGKLGNEALMGMVRNHLTVSFRQSRERTVPVFDLAFSHADRAVAAEVLTDVTNRFIDENLKDRAQQASATAEFLDHELQRLREEVTTQEARIREFRMERMGTLPSQLDANLRSLDRLNLELAGNLEAQEAGTQRLALVRQQRAGARVGSGGGPAAPTTLSSALLAARQELIQAERIYTEEHPNVKSLRQEVARLQKLLAEEPPDAAERDLASLDPALVALDSEATAASLEIEGRRRQEARIRQEIAELQARVEQTPEREQEELELTRDYDNLMETYRDLLTKKYEAALARNLEQAQVGERFKVLRPVRVPRRPAWPDPLILLPAGLGVGLLFTLLIVLIDELRRPAFRSVERLTRAIGLPVFASIPRIDNDRIYENAPTGDVDPKLVVHTAPESAPAEQYRGFLPTFLEAEGCRVILVTSAARGDGKSLTCMNLAASLGSDLGRRVLVIDGDLRRPSAHRLLRMRAKLGLADILRGNAELDECTMNAKLPNLTLVAAGRPTRNPLVLLTSPAFLQLLEEAKKRYDVILIDSPPLLPVVDTKILRRMADMVLFVVRADATPRDGVIRSLADMRDVAGVIFNQVSPGSFRRYYYYDAYSRYAYGDPPAPEASHGHGRRG